MSIAISGATGYIGARLLEALLGQGREVLALTRVKFDKPGVNWLSFRLEDSTPLLLPNDVEVVVHLAASTKGHRTCSANMEIASAKRMIEAAKNIGATFIFVSSQAVSSRFASDYSYIKRSIEGLTVAAGGLVIRPGQVYGGDERGQFGQICNIVKKSFLLPAFMPDPLIQPVHIDDLVFAILRYIDLKPTGAIFMVGDPVGIRFTIFLKATARLRYKKTRLFIPIPQFLIRYAVLFSQKNSHLKFIHDRLNSLFLMRFMDGVSNDLNNIQLELRPLGAGMAFSGKGRRELVREGYQILAYILGSIPARSNVIRYVRIIEKLCVARPIKMPKIVRHFHLLIGLLDSNKFIDKGYSKKLQWRLKAAMLIAEASTQGSIKFMNNELHGFQSAIKILQILMMEGYRLGAQIVFAPFLLGFGSQGIFDD